MMGVDWNVNNMGDYGGLMFSSDYGDTWAMASGFPTNYNIGALEVLPGGTVLVGVRSHFLDRDSGGIWRGGWRGLRTRTSKSRLAISTWSTRLGASRSKT